MSLLFVFSRRCIVLAAGLPLLAGPLVALAEEQATDTQLKEVEVTAEPAVETPSLTGSTTTLDRAEIQRRGAQNVGEALRGEAGISVSSDSAHGQNPVIRGLQKERVVLLVDGLRLNAEQPFGAISSLMSLDLADRVNVVKGPASVLYGSGALGGAINVELRQAKFEPGIGGEVSATYDSASSGLRGSGLVNLSGGDHALMAGVSQARMGDYRSPAGKVGQTGYDSEAYIAQYRFRIDASQQLRISVQQQSDTDVWYPGTRDQHPLVTVPPPIPVWWYEGQSQSDVTWVFHSPYQQRELFEIGYNGRIDGAMPATVDVRVYKQDMTRTVNAWADFLGEDIVRTSVVFATEGIETKADWLVHPQHLLTFGVSAWRMEASPTRFMRPAIEFGPWATAAKVPPFENAYVESLGTYLLDEMDIDKWKVIAGLRHDTVEGGAAKFYKGLDMFSPITNGSVRKDSNLSGGLLVSYDVAPLLRPYVSINRAFRAPSLIERFVVGPRGDGYWYAGNPQTKPEIADQIELGVKGTDSTLNYSVAAYHNRIKDYITGIPLPSDVNLAFPDLTGNVVCGGPFKVICKATGNLGEAVIVGLEASARWQFSRGHWLTVKYSRIRGTNKDLDEPLFRMPADEVSIGWEGPAVFLGPRWTADATLRLVARQDRVATKFTSVGLPMWCAFVPTAPGCRSSVEDPTPGFGTIDIGSTWNYERNQSLRIALKNLADKSYHEHLAVGVPGRELDAPGRTLQLVWQGSF